MVDAMYRQKISLIRKHPLFTVLFFLFFAFSFIIVLAFLWSGTGASLTRRSRYKVNTYRLPADFSFATEALGLEPQPVGPVSEASVVTGSIDEGRKELLFNAVSLIVAAAVGLGIAILVTRMMVP